MRMSRRMGLYAGKSKVVVSIYGAASETITITPANGSAITVKTNASGSAGTKTLAVGSYTVKGSVSGYSKTVTVGKSTTRVDAWPNNATIYYWYGYAPNGGWNSIATLPNTSTYTSNPVAPEITDSTNSVFISTTWDYSRGGTAYLPKTKIGGSSMKLVCSGVKNNAYVSLNLSPSLVAGNVYTPAKVVSIATGSTAATVDVSSVSGGSYYPSISMNSASYSNGSYPSEITVHALYSV